MQHETIRGRIRYTSKRKGTLDQDRGGETYVVTKHVDGSRTIRCHCAIDESSPRVLRDTQTTFDAEWHPTSGFYHLMVDEAFVGSAWYRFTQDSAECEGFTVREGRVSHRFENSGWPGKFVTHAMQGDAFETSAYDVSRGPGVHQQPLTMSCSSHYRGADGPTLIKSTPGGVMSFLGREEVTVAAGTFPALHFRFGTSEDDDYLGTDVHPPYHGWVTADGDYILLKAHITGYVQAYYELVEYEKRVNFF
jgi:hypothetical protein